MSFSQKFLPFPFRGHDPHPVFSPSASVLLGMSNTAPTVLRLLHSTLSTIPHNTKTFAGSSHIPASQLSLCTPPVRRLLLGLVSRRGRRERGIQKLNYQSYTHTLENTFGYTGDGAERT